MTAWEPQLEGFKMDGKLLNDEFTRRAGDNVEKGLMSRKEQFLAFVCVGALAQDFSRKTNDTALILHIASRIPEDHIPDNVSNAAKVFLAYCSGLCKRPHLWMLARG